MIYTRLNARTFQEVWHQIQERIVNPNGKYDAFETQRFGQQILNRMAQADQCILLIEARDGASLKGFVIAESLYDCVWISQMWSDKENPQDVADRLFLEVLMWAVALGKKSVRAETKRNTEALYRRVKFQERSVIVERIIDDDLVDKITARAREVFNG